MNSLAIAAFEQLRNTQLFCSAGVSDTDAAKVLASWTEALDHCNSRQWESWCLEAANQIGDKVRAASVAQYERWNDITREVKENVIPLVASKCEPVARSNGLPESFFFTVRWDVLHFFVEVEYADIAPPGFYHSQWKWYMKGHFPCGWVGAFPSGRPIIY